MRFTHVSSALARAKTWKYTPLLLGALCILFLSISSYRIAEDGKSRYEALLSKVLYDRNNLPLTIAENAKGHYAYTLTSIPDIFKTLLIQKEDRFFYYHPGVNPMSTFRAFISFSTGHAAGGASTLTQQLAKNILHTESNRTVRNKIIESVYALSLELFTTKEDILLMYANTVFLGNQVQGFETGSRAYFNKSLSDTTQDEQLSLLATLSHPSTRNPWKKDNIVYAQALHDRLVGTEPPYHAPFITDTYAFQEENAFELNSAHITYPHTCYTTIDTSLTDALRKILERHIESEKARGARNGAIVVIDAHTSELLALIGSPDPQKQSDGGQINMALEPRPIGSTIKPLIYLKGFMEGLRPYSKVDDREYKYPIATGFSLYPKNFDGKYHGEITLHTALSNSLNVPSVKVLEYIGLSTFYTFLSDTLQFEPIQPYDSYQYGIALGGLEMDLLTLTHYFTIFPRMGTIAPLRTISGIAEQPKLPPQSHISTTRTVAEPKYVELVHAIISDRLTGVEQFGLKSNLNLTIPEYGVKTGTSRDFHDSWVVGYTPDYVVGVWVGNSENEALKQVTGQSGAGAIWHDAMEYLGTTPYTTKRTFSQRDLYRFQINNSLEWGLPDDVVSAHESRLLEDRLILSPHEQDTFELEKDTVIPLRARTKVLWSANGKALSENPSEETHFSPTEIGSYEVKAHDPLSNKTEYLQLEIVTAQ